MKLPPIAFIVGWIARRLSRKLALTLAASLAFAAFCLLALLTMSYRERMQKERAFVAAEINRLLQISLENAMLNRDILGLRQIVERLGRQEEIAGVMILTPTGEVRFASDTSQLHRRFDLGHGELCPACTVAAKPGESYTTYVAGSNGPDLLRSVNPVHNREPCTQCHGPVAATPVNGILVVDYKASHIQRETLWATLVFSGASVLVLLAAIGGIAWMLQRAVIGPVAQLTRAASALSIGQLGERVTLTGQDEMARLGSAFNGMAERIQKAIGELATRERDLQSLIDAIPDGVRVIDEDYVVVKANAAYCQQQGLGQSEIIGQPCFKSSHGRDAPCAATLVTCPLRQLSTDAGEATLTCRHRHVRADKTELTVEVSAARLLLDIGGRPRKLIVEVIRDLTRQMHISHEQRLSEIGLLAAGVAHEIHNPLASIHLGFNGLSRELAEGHTAKAAEYIRIIDEEISRCIEVTSRLLRLSMPPSDMPELVTLDTVATDVLSLLTAEALKVGVTVRLDVVRDMRVIAADSEMRMVVLNLAQNALHAMPKGGQLAVTGRAEGGMVVLTIEDTGVGIPAEDLPQIFDPFWSRRADGSRGTGLGLPICREIIKRLGGEIVVTSELGKGTRFVVKIPSADTEVAAA